MTDRIDGEGLIVLLGWSIDDFESEVKKADVEALAQCRKILASPNDPAMPEFYVQLVDYGVREIDDELRRRKDG